MYIKKIAISIVLGGLVAMALFSYFVYNVMFTPNTSFKDEKVYIFISTGSDYQQVRHDLKPLLKNIKTFDILARQKKYISNIKPGKYLIKNGMTNNNIINSIRTKNIPIIISFNNQHTLELLALRISNQIEADSLSLINAFKQTNFLESNGFTEQNVLALFLPNSYEFYWNSSPNEFISKIITSYDRFWNEDRLIKANEIGLTSIEVSILASIVQEESRKIKELPRIAGVYINRLKNNWFLQADPTLKFAASKSTAFKNKKIKRVLNVHKTIESPYNTYLNLGLPPGLISMPDLASIDAVLDYEKHNYFYFVADFQRPGFHIFSKDLKSHNKNAKLYHKYLDKIGVKE